LDLFALATQGFWQNNVHHRYLCGKEISVVTSI